MNGLCPPDMASVDDQFCVDKYEASLVEILPNGDERPCPFYHRRSRAITVRAVSEQGVYPQGYISEKQADEACARSGKRLCKPHEWKTACMGPDKHHVRLRQRARARHCNDNGRSPIGVLRLAQRPNGTAWTSNKMNDPQLNQLPGTLAETGSHEGCTNGYGVYDMVGNLHEWVDDPDGHVPGRLLPRHAQERRRLRLPHRRARGLVPRLLDRLPLLR